MGRVLSIIKSLMNKKLHVLAYIFIIVGYALPLIYLLAFRFVEEFTLPTAIYAVSTVKAGRLLSQEEIHCKHFWGITMNVEANYPFPSLFISILYVITSIPIEQIPFFPLNCISSIIYLVLARRILGKDNIDILFSSLYFSFISFSLFNIGYFGRASSGSSIFITYFLFTLIVLFQKKLIHKTCYSEYILLILFTLTIGLTYYISTASIIITTLALLIFARFFNLFLRKSMPTLGLAIPIFAIFLFIRNPFIAAFLHNRPIIQEIIQFIITAATFEPTQKRIQQSVFPPISYDLLTYILKEIAFLVRLISILAVFISIFLFWPRKERHVRIIWLFSLVILFFSVGEAISYRSLSPRFLTNYGLILVFYILKKYMYVNDSEKINVRPNTLRMKKSIGRNLIILLITVAITLSCYGLIRNTWYYTYDPFIWYKVHAPSEFIRIFSSREYIMITGDVNVVAQVYYHTFVDGKTHVATEPLFQDLSTLYQVVLKGDFKDFASNMDRRNINYMLLIKTSKPIHASASWTDIQTIPLNDVVQILQVNSNIVYNNGNSVLMNFKWLYL